MAKAKQTPMQPAANVRTPAGHFNSNGQSQGKSVGAVRPQADACNEVKKERK